MSTSVMSHPPKRTSTSFAASRIGILLSIAALMVLGGITLGVAPVAGTDDSESFHCGTPLHLDNSEGYRGSAGFAVCNETRRLRGGIAAGSVLLGAGIGTQALVMRRKKRLIVEARQAASVRA
jgi:hypothetical protein